MELRKLSETSTTLTLGWDVVAMAQWYLFYADNARVSNAPAFDKNGVPKTSIKFNKGDEPYEIVCITRTGTGVYGTDVGVWTGAPPPDPGGLSPIATPQGQLTPRNSALFIRSFGNGLTEKVHVTSAPDFGIGVMQWPPAEWSGTYVVRDCIAENVVLPPFDWEGFNEACLWFGQKVHAHRLVARNAEWMGMFTGSRFADSLVEDFQLLNMPWIGLYPEHVSCDSTFRRFNIESKKNAINVEWWYPDTPHNPFADARLSVPTNGRAGSWGLKFYDGRVRSQDGYCAYLDAGTFGCEFGVDGYLDLDGPYGIILPRRLQDPNRPNIVKAENINWNSIPPERRITYHDSPMGVYKTSRFAFSLGRGRIEGKQPHQQIRDWTRLGALVG